jgi:hypothetical protein
MFKLGLLTDNKAVLFWELQVYSEVQKILRKALFFLWLFLPTIVTIARIFSDCFPLSYFPVILPACRRI